MIAKKLIGTTAILFASVIVVPYAYRKLTYYSPGTRVVLIEGDGPRDDMGGILFAVPGPPGSTVWHADPGYTGIVLRDPTADGRVEVRVEYDKPKTGWIDRRDLAPIR